MAKEGISFILGIVLFSLILTAGSWISGKPLLIIATVISWILTIFSLYFFRDPARVISGGDHLILSPGDGKIIAITEEHEPDFFNDNVNKISIFLSVFDVHINRIPVDGRVTHFNYIRGKFFPAFKDKASTENEQTIIGIENEKCKVLFKQIAGIIARRIVCNVREGHKVKQGERFGMIKFGSRIDIFLPKEIDIKVNMNDRVKGGISIIGVINEK